DQAGNEDLTPASLSFAVVDATPPETTVANAVVTDRNVTVTWTGSDVVTPTAGLTFAFRLDPIDTGFSAFGTATSKTYTTREPGQSCSSARPRAPGGSEDQPPAGASFPVAEATPPDPFITSGPPGDVLAPGRAPFSWTGPDDAPPAPALVFASRLDPVEP